MGLAHAAPQVAWLRLGSMIAGMGFGGAI